MTAQSRKDSANASFYNFKVLWYSEMKLRQITFMQNLHTALTEYTNDKRGRSNVANSEDDHQSMPYMSWSNVMDALVTSHPDKIYLRRVKTLLDSLSEYNDSLFSQFETAFHVRNYQDCSAAFGSCFPTDYCTNHLILHRNDLELQKKSTSFDSPPLTHQDLFFKAHTALEDRESEMKWIVEVGHPEFFARLHAKILARNGGNESEWESFLKLLYISRSQLGDSNWIEKVCRIIKTPVDIVTFKRLVTYNGYNVSVASFPKPPSSPSENVAQHFSCMIPQDNPPRIRCTARDQFSTPEGFQAAVQNNSSFFDIVLSVLNINTGASRTNVEATDYARFVFHLKIPRDDLSDAKWIGFINSRYFKGSAVLRTMFRKIVGAVCTTCNEEMTEDEDLWSDNFDAQIRSDSAGLNHIIELNQSFIDEIQSAMEESQKSLSNPPGRTTRFTKFMNIVKAPRSILTDYKWMTFIDDALGHSIDPDSSHHFLTRFTKLFHIRQKLKSEEFVGVLLTSPSSTPHDPQKSQQEHVPTQGLYETCTSEEMGTVIPDLLTWVEVKMKCNQLDESAPRRSLRNSSFHLLLQEYYREWIRLEKNGPAIDYEILKRVMEKYGVNGEDLSL